MSSTESGPSFSAENPVRSPLHPPRRAWQLAASLVLLLSLPVVALAGEPDAPPSAAPALFEPAMPTIPESISRPAGWPTAAPTALNNHVLSSILELPGGPLEPVDENGNLLPLTDDSATPQRTGTEESKPASDGTVVLADYQEAVTSPSTATASSASAELPGMKSIEMAMVVARVGSEVVLAGDLMTPAASEWLAKVSPGLKPEQI